MALSGLVEMALHRPVMVEEVSEALALRPGGIYVDATVGEGGHAEAMLERSGPTGRVIGCDRDPSILQEARARLERFGARCLLQSCDYRRLPELLASLDVVAVDGILIDLGISSYHLARPERGFSFAADGPLDMRIDPSLPEGADALLRRLTEPELTGLIVQYGEERWARRIARAILREQETIPITTTRQLASIIERAVPPAARFGRRHPATRTFQALRIAVNRELDGLDRALLSAVDCLAPGGRLCLLTYHSLEDRIVKRTFLAMAKPAEREATPVVRLLTKKPRRPGQQEVGENPRARSAKLRAVERVAA